MQMKSTKKERNVHAERQPQRQKAQRHLYSADWRRWLVSGITQISGIALGMMQILALGSAKIYQHVGISNAKFWHRGHCPMPTPDARYFTLQWSTGFSNSEILQ